MKRRRFRPPLNKRRIASEDGYAFYSISALAVRNVSERDEEFTTFATADDLPDLIPEGEVWISENLVAKERVFFIANALARLKELEAGSPLERAYTVGLNAERKLREERTGLEYRAGKPHARAPEKLYSRRYITLPDEEFPIEVWLVEGWLVRCYYKTDYAEGGHGYVYPWVPKKEIWVEATLDEEELPFIVAHEYLEHRLMRDEKLEYDEAHEICSSVEFDLRKAPTRRAYPGLSQRRFTRDELAKLTDPALFEYVVKRHVRRSGPRQAASRRA
jgi:hypothetical protein